MVRSLHFKKTISKLTFGILLAFLIFGDSGFAQETKWIKVGTGITKVTNKNDSRIIQHPN